jgi:thiol:disulfide interchange protein DsbD
MTTGSRRAVWFVAMAALASSSALSATGGRQTSIQVSETLRIDGARVVLAAAEADATARPSTEASGVLSKLRSLAHGAEADEEFLPLDKAFKVDVKAKDAHTLVAEFTPASSYYLYRDKIAFALPKESGISIASVALPPGEMKSDPNFGDTEVFHHPFRAVVTLDRGSAHNEQPLQVEARYQGCSEKGLCYPPAKKTFELTVAALGPAAGTASDVGRSIPSAQRTPAPLVEAASGPRASASAMSDERSRASDSSLDEASKMTGILKSGRYWLVMASFFGAGLLLSFTPCVLPMVPILSGIIVGQGRRVTRKVAFLLTLSYVAGMAVTYALAGVGAGLSGTLLSNALQNPWVLGAFAALFVGLSLSMFGLYELQLPAAFQSRLADTSNKVGGGTLWGVFTMGVLSALIVGPCVAAPLAGALLYINQTRDAFLGGTALFALALGMGVPLLAVGLSAGTLLPKAGAWMQTIKSLFGVMLLGLAIWIISPVLPSTVHMLLWASLLIVSAMYLHAIDPLPHNASGLHRLWKGIGVIALLIGVALLAGALSGGRDILQPLAGLRAGAATLEVGSQRKFERVRSLVELDRRVAEAGGKPVMLDFYADWCVSCKEMERFTFGDPQVQARMGRMLLLQADVTANTDEDQELLRRFGLFGPPGILFFGRDGREVERARVIGFQPAGKFVESLDAVLGRS